MRIEGRETIASVDAPSTARLVMGRGNYARQKLNFVSRIQLSEAHDGTAFTRWPPNTGVCVRYARARARAQLHVACRIRNELFAKFMQICMNRGKWVRRRSRRRRRRRRWWLGAAGGGRGDNAPYSRVINIHELQHTHTRTRARAHPHTSHSVLFSPLCSSSVPASSHGFLFVLSAVAFREGEILLRRRAHLHAESRREDRHECELR